MEIVGDEAGGEAIHDGFEEGNTGDDDADVGMKDCQQDKFVGVPCFISGTGDAEEVDQA